MTSSGGALFFAAAALLCVACGSTTPSSRAGTDANRTNAGDLVPSSYRRSGLLRWNEFPGPMVPPSSEGPIVWVVAPLPNSDWTANLSIFRAEVGAAQPNALVFTRQEGAVHVPGAFTQPIAAAAYDKGQAVLVAESVGLTTGASYGRVAKVVREQGQTRYLVKKLYGNDWRMVTVDPEALLPLRDSLTMGAPAAYQVGSAWREVVYVAPGLDRERAWVLDFSDRAEQRPSLRPLVVSKVHKKGDRVWAAQFSTLEPAVVLDVIEGGLQYRLRIANAWEETLGFDRVTDPF